MILTRTSIALLVVATLTGFALCSVAAREVDRAATHATELELRADALRVGEIVAADARARLDAIDSIASAPEMRALLRTATAGDAAGAIDPAAAAGLRDRLEAQRAQLDPDALVLLAAPSGAPIAQLGAAGELDGRALRALRDTPPEPGAADVWTIGAAQYVVATRTIHDGDRILATIAVGERLDDALARRLSGRLDDAEVVLVAGARAIASAPQHAPAGEIAAAIDRAGDARAQGPIAIGASELAIHRPLGARSDLGVVVARTVPRVGSPLGLIGEARAEDWISGLGSASGVGSVLAALLALALALGALWWEGDRQLRGFAHATARLAAGECQELDVASVSGPLANAGRDVNRAIEKLRAAHLAEVFGSVPPGAVPRPSPLPADPATSPAPAARASAAEVAAPRASAAEVAAPRASAAEVAAPRPSVAEAAAPRASSAEAPAPRARAAGAAATPPRTDPAPPPPPRAQLAAPEPPRPAAPPRLAPVSAPTLAARASSDVFALGPDDDDDEQDVSDATMISLPTAELLGRSRTAGLRREGDAAIRDVFDEYVATKTRCGEPTKGLTYEKFLGIVERSRDQFREAHGRSPAGFRVQVKNGRAVLTLVPG